MSAAKSAFKLTIGYKILMALTGIILIGFLIAHLTANLLVFVGPESLNAYGIKLREYPVLLWIARGVLILSAILHIYAGIKLSLINKQARLINYKAPKQTESTLASRTMLVSGCVVLFFLLYHLAHFTFKWTHHEMFAFLDEHDVYSMVVMSFKSPWVAGFYCIAMVLLMSHLYHGVRSFFQTLGINHPKYNRIIQCIGPVLSILLTLGFLSIPISVFLRLVE